MVTVGAVLPTVICSATTLDLPWASVHVQPGAVLPVGGVRVTGGHTGRVVGSVAVEVPLIGQRRVLGIGRVRGVEATVSGAAPPEVGSASSRASGRLFPGL